MPPTDQAIEGHGLSVFLRNGDAAGHTHSTDARGADALLGTYQYLDLTPLGHQEDWEPDGRGTDPMMSWPRRHDEYEEAAR